MIDVIPQSAALDLRGRRRAFHAGVGDEAGDVAPVRLTRLGRRSLLQREKVVEPLEVERAGNVVVQMERYSRAFPDAFSSQIATTSRRSRRRRRGDHTRSDQIVLSGIPVIAGPKREKRDEGEPDADASGDRRQDFQRQAASSRPRTAERWPDAGQEIDSRRARQIRSACTAP